MDDLIPRLEAATEGNRLLNEAIAKEEGTFRSKRSKDEIHGLHFGPEYSTPSTTSLDAKLPGENIVEVTLHDGVWAAIHVNPETGLQRTGIGSTEPLARRIAALKARSIDRTGENDG